MSSLTIIICQAVLSIDPLHIADKTINESEHILILIHQPCNIGTSNVYKTNSIAMHQPLL